MENHQANTAATPAIQELVMRGTPQAQGTAGLHRIKMRGTLQKQGATQGCGTRPSHNPNLCHGSGMGMRNQ